MADEWLVRMLRMFARPKTPPVTEHADLQQIDARLGAVEGNLHELDIRLELLEKQADPRGILRGHDGG